jgi:hypothetical protein
MTKSSMKCGPFETPTPPSLLRPARNLCRPERSEAERIAAGHPFVSPPSELPVRLTLHCSGLASLTAEFDVKHFTATDGAIRVSASKNGVVGPVVEIDPAHLRKLALTIVSVLRYVDGTWEIDQVREKILRHDLDELAMLHALPPLGQKRPFHTCVRLYLTSSDPLRFDPMTIREDLAARYVDQDCSFDLRILMVRGSEVAEAYLLPWALFAVEGAEWKQRIDLQQYRTVIPSDIQPEHLRSGAG